MAKVITNKGSEKKHTVTVDDSGFFSGKKYYEVCVMVVGEGISKDIVNKKVIPKTFEQKSRWKKATSAKYTHMTALVDYPHANIFIKEIEEPKQEPKKDDTTE